MWKVSCLLLLLITIGNCSTYDPAKSTDTENSRNVRNYENRRYHSNGKKIEYRVEERPHEYARDESEEEFEDGKVVGKWRNNGDALEPKWRDGDSVPLVPFNEPKQTNVARHDVVDSSKWRDYSHAVTKSNIRDDGRGRNNEEESVEETIEKIPNSEDYRPLGRVRNDRYSMDSDYERRYRDGYEDSRGYGGGFLRRGRKPRPATILTDELRYETKDETESSSKRIEGVGTGDESTIDDKDDAISRSRYRDTFQAHPNEYELNDEEYQKPRPRKRRPPQNYEFSDDRAPTYSVTWSTEKYSESSVGDDKPKWTKEPEISTVRHRKPDEKLNPIRRDRNRAASMDAQRASENAELKSLLKMQQVEGLSLSELLQRRNLTLNDLLKGKSEVINVLKSKDESNEDPTGIPSVKPKIFDAKKVSTTERPKWRPSQPVGIKNTESVRKQVSSHVSKNENDVPLDNLSTDQPEDEDSMEEMFSAETEDGQRKSNDNEKLSAIVRLTKPIILPRLNSFNEKSTIITTTTTTEMTTTPTMNDYVAKDFVKIRQNDENIEKSVKASTSFDEDEIMEFSDFTMKKSFDSNTRPATGIIAIKANDQIPVDVKFDDVYEDSGSTLSIEHILSPTEQSVTNLPMTSDEFNKTFDTRVNAVVMEGGHANDTDHFDNLDSDYQSDEPHEIPEENEPDEELPMGDQPYEEMTTNSQVEDKTSSEEGEILLKNHQIFSTSSKPYEVVISEIEPEARAEIFELFSSGSSAKRLERLLKSRNMSIDELIALRQRGSSKVHLAEVLRSRETLGSRSQKYNVKNQMIDRLDDKRDEGVGATEENVRETTTDDLSDIEIDMTSVEESEQVVTEEQSNISSIGTERANSDSVTEKNSEKHLQLLELLTAFDSLPFSMRPDLETTARPKHTEETKISGETEDERIPEDFVEKTKRPDLRTSLVEVGLVEEIAKDDPIPVEDLSESRTNDSVDRIGEERKNLSKVRPSIIASGAILGVTIVVFLAIFIVCRIRQKQKYTYRNTFSRAVFQGPVMTARKLSNSSSLNTIMVNVVATSTTKRPERHEIHGINDDFECKSDIENDSLDANDSWDTIPDFMK